MEPQNPQPSQPSPQAPPPLSPNSAPTPATPPSPPVPGFTPAQAGMPSGVTSDTPATPVAGPTGTIGFDAPANTPPASSVGFGANAAGNGSAPAQPSSAPFGAPSTPTPTPPAMSGPLPGGAPAPGHEGGKKQTPLWILWIIIIVVLGVCAILFVVIKNRSANTEARTTSPSASIAYAEVHGIKLQ